MFGGEGRFQELDELSVASEDKSESRRGQILVVCKDTAVSHQLRGTLLELGISNVAAEYSHGKAIERMKEKSFTDVFFDSEETDMTAIDFIHAVKSIKKDIGLIAMASKLNINDVFELLRVGARSFLLYPFTFEAVENSIKQVSQDYEIREDLLNSDKDISETLTEVALTNFNMLCRLISLREGQRGTPELEALIKDRKQTFRDSVEVAKTTNTAGGAEVFRDKIVEICINHAMDTASRISRVRKKLRMQREQGKAGR